MFQTFFLSMQQDIKLFFFFPVLCAIFRTIFIKVYNPYDSLAGKGHIIWHCYRYGFWWGMDFNAYVFLISLILVTLPVTFAGLSPHTGDMIRVYGGLAYALILYGAFAGKMIFYYHFHDIFNQTLRLGAKAEKHNLIDIFFHQDHGAAIIAGGFVYWFVCKYSILAFLHLPSVPYPIVGNTILVYIMNTGIVLALIVGFYWFRYGGTLLHDNKPEWDTIPAIVKKDIFFARATVDDLPALKAVWKKKPNELLEKTDEENKQAIAAIIGKNDSYGNPLLCFKRTANGPAITKPSHIFMLVGESYMHQLFEPAYTCLNLVSGGNILFHDPHTATLPNFLSAGIISRPSIVSLMTGIFDAGLELNEREAWWHGTVPTALPMQLKRLGYRSTYWYGGSLTHGNFNQFAPACGFDRAMSATEFCGADAPKTWVGVYDNVFLEKAAELIQKQDSGYPEFHFLYTTSFHGPFKIDLKKYGYSTEGIMPDAPAAIKEDKAIQKELGTFWFSDQAVGRFIQTMRKAYPDCLFIVTADHAINLSCLKKMTGHDETIHDRRTPVIMLNHRELNQSILSGNVIGSHMHIMPTIMELIAPKGFTYYSWFPSMTEPLDHVISPANWLRADAMGYYDNDFYQPLGPNYSPTALKEGPRPYVSEIEGMKAVTAYLVNHPELLKSADEWISMFK